MPPGPSSCIIIRLPDKCVLVPAQYVSQRKKERQTPALLLCANLKMWRKLKERNKKMKKRVKNLFNLPCRKFVFYQWQPLRSVERAPRRQVKTFVSSSTNISGSPGTSEMQSQGILPLFSYLFWIAWERILNKDKTIWLRNPNYRMNNVSLPIGNPTCQPGRETPDHGQVRLSVIVVLNRNPSSLVELPASNPSRHMVRLHEFTEQLPSTQHLASHPGPESAPSVLPSVLGFCSWSMCPHYGPYWRNVQRTLSLSVSSEWTL